MEQDRKSTLEKIMFEHASKNQRPINGSLELLPLCNMNCTMCYVRLTRREQEQQGRLRTADEWIALGREMVNAGVLFLLLTGGEPLLFPGFKDIFSEFKKMGMILTVNTNGTLLDEEWADFFGRYKPRRINITLYGSDEEAYTSLCHYPGGFHKTIRAIQLLKERDVKVKINGSVTRDNWKDMKEIYRIGKDLDVPVAMDTYMLPGLRERNLSFSCQSRLEPEAAARAEWNVLQEDMQPEFLEKYVQRIIEEVENGVTAHPDCITCMAGNCSFTVDWKGKMRPCVTLEEPSVPVFEMGFESAWQKVSAGAKIFRMNEKCTVCRLRPICKTCVASAKIETGCYEGAPEYLCRYTTELYRLMKEREV